MINNGFVLTSAEMLAAENSLIDEGTFVDVLMQRAGQGAAQQIWRVSGNLPTLVLCGPGNNGGDGYVIAEWLRKKGVPVVIAATGEPKTNAAENARSLWKGDVLTIEDASSTQQVIDCLFGTGLRRPVSGNLLERYLQLCNEAKMCVAIDVPSGVETDTAQLLNEVPDFDLTIALGATKPAHFIEPARSKAGTVLPVDIGIDATSNIRVVSKPCISAPDAKDHKYTRGFVAIVAGKMPGAAQLSALAAQNTGAGYVKIFAPQSFRSPHASIVVQNYDNVSELSELLKDDRLDAVVLGPGLGRDTHAEAIVDTVLESDHQLVIDADALTVLGKSFSKSVSERSQATIATPHYGEFQQIVDEANEDKIYCTQTLAKKANATILNKGSDTVIAQSTGDVALTSISNSWLSTAGTGDVLSGIIAARLARGIDPFLAAQEGHWLHNRAAQLAGPAFSPEALIEKIPIALEECL